MHTPTKAQFQTVIDNLNKVVKKFGVYNERNFNMHQGCTSDRNNTICDTVHCIGGWYAIAKLAPFKHHVSYQHGADAMAEDLGFDDYSDLKKWANHNPIIWGNEYGYAMFMHEDAYNGAKTLVEAIAHLEQVKNRLPV